MKKLCRLSIDGLCKVKPTVWKGTPTAFRVQHVSMGGLCNPNDQPVIGANVSCWYTSSWLKSSYIISDTETIEKSGLHEEAFFHLLYDEVWSIVHEVAGGVFIRSAVIIPDAIVKELNTMVRIWVDEDPSYSFGSTKELTLAAYEFFSSLSDPRDEWRRKWLW